MEKVKELLKPLWIEKNLTNKRLVELYPDLSMQQRYNLMEAKAIYMILAMTSYIPYRIDTEFVKRYTDEYPTQIVRSAAKDKLQQFSTPLHLALFITNLLELKKDDILLDSSAGTGSLLMFARIKGLSLNQIYANEIDQDRVDILEYFGYKTTKHNAEFINDLLDYSIKPTKIIMNPPFSAGLKTNKNNTKYGFQHLISALDRLEMNGRLVCMLGESCMNHKQIWIEIANKPNINIIENYTISGSEWYKNGTTFGSQVVVIDKTHKTKTTADQIKTLYTPKNYNTNSEVDFNRI